MLSASPQRVALKLRKTDKELFDFCVNVLPDLSYGFKGCLPLGHDWYSSVFLPLAMEGPVGFQNLVLAYAATVQAQVKGKVETSLSLKHQREPLKCC